VSDKNWHKAKEQYHIGQAVIARIVQTVPEENKFLVSIRMKECYQGNTDVDIIEDYLAAVDCMRKGV
jgi:ribosomal protein S1